MRWVVLGLLSLMFWLAPACSMSEIKLHCPRPSSERQAMKALADRIFVPFDADKDIANLRISSYYDLCGREPDVVACAGGGDGKLSLAVVKAVDARLRASFEYQDDILVFGKDDFWEPMTNCGDCEDYVLHLSETLHANGQGGKHMGLILWMTDEGEGHATLAVDTSDVGVVEVGVSPDGAPAPINWREGVRIAVIWMDGSRKVSAVPGWPAPIVKNGGVMAPTVAHKK